MNTSTNVLMYTSLSLNDIQTDKFSRAIQSVLDAINQKIAAAESLDKIMNFLFDETKSIFPCDRIGLAFIEEESQRVVSQWARADYEPILLGKGYSEEISGSTLEPVVRLGQVRVIHDLETYLANHPDSRSTRLLVREGVRSSMTCALRVENRIAGLLWRSSRQKDAYSDLEVRMHVAIAERLSQAIEKAWHIEQLESANKAYFEMLGFVSHELKSPVSSMVTQGNMLMQGYYGELQEKQKTQIEKLINKGEYLLRLVREYLDLARIEGGEMTLNSVPGVDFIQQVVEPTVDIISVQVLEKQMEIIRQFDPEKMKVEVDTSLFHIVMVNLLSNAVKYGVDKGKISIQVQKGDSGLHIEVQNDGPGFPESERSKLFRKFSRLQTPELLQRKGTGVGLYTVFRIVRLHSGRIRAESEPGKWARFIIDIPQPLPGSD